MDVRKREAMESKRRKEERDDRMEGRGGKLAGSESRSSGSSSGSDEGDEEGNGELEWPSKGAKRRKYARGRAQEEDEAEESGKGGGMRQAIVNSVGGVTEDEDEDDHDEANADLSLRIVARAEELRTMRAGVSNSTNSELKIEESESDEEEQVEVEDAVDQRRDGNDTIPVVQEEAEEGEVVEVGSAAERGGTPEEGELQEDAELNPVFAIKLDEDVKDDSMRAASRKEERREKKGREKKERRGRKEKKDKKDKKKKSIVENAPPDEGQSTQVSLEDEALEGVELKDGAAEESIVMRRLLRGPRYFDPPEEQAESCFNCGKVGHLAAACPEGPRSKPCYVCGGFGHDGRACPQKTECYVCGKVGHIAKTCPNKNSSRASGRDGSNVCLLCGRSGHEVSNCYYSYDKEDMEQVQCYVCKDFGHLCCIDVIETSPGPVSCFMCGEMGHTGARCARPRRSDRDGDRGLSSVCFNCGEEGHYARSCSKRSAPPWPAPWSPETQGRYAGSDRYQSRSAPRPRWMDLQYREPRWTPSRKSNLSDRWNESSAHDKFHSAVDDHDAIDDYMGPIENFAGTSQDRYRKGRRKRSWTSTTSR